ncbi:MAG: hypothetical protein AAB336_12300 [Acidobacteriota bacterium]
MKNLSPNTQILANDSFPKAIPINWLARLFGCWHKKMGNPFTRGNQTYSSCRTCGACRKFDMVKWKNVGPYFYNPILELYDELPMKTEPILSDFNLVE